MEFLAATPITNKAERAVWENLRRAFGDDEGFAYSRYPIYRTDGLVRFEPDILVLHREFGVFLLECKGMHIEHIASIQGHLWTMRDWHSEEETPTFQLEDQVFAVKNRFDQHRELRNRLFLRSRVALPFITRTPWREAGFDETSIDPVIALREDLTPEGLRRWARASQEAQPQPFLTDAMWARLQLALGNGIARRSSLSPTRDKSSGGVPAGAPADHPARVIRAVEASLPLLDRDQQRFAIQSPPGPQRLRGLAGAGKTILLAKRAARLHFDRPDLEIAFVFFTKSLYAEVRERILAEHRFLTGDESEPDWGRLRVLHAWGGKTTGDGLYHRLCLLTGIRPQAWSRDTRFEQVCDELAHHLERVPECFDAIFVDEGQDLPASLYRLALKSLREPKRLYWAYDEAQGIGNLSVPEAARLFGRTLEGAPVVDLSGRYEGGLPKSLTMRQCYRTPRLTLMVAHAVNMGLYRPGGPVQGLTQKDEWRAIGYEVVLGDFSRAGAPVMVTRSEETNAHPLDKDANLRALSEEVGPILETKRCSSTREEQSWIADQIWRDLERGFRAEDVLVVALDDGYGSTRYLTELKTVLENRGVLAHIAQGDVFRTAGRVTLSSVFRAKGNEAHRVYACRFELATTPVQDRSEVHARNAAFVALTRSKLWVRVSAGGDAPVLEEVHSAIENMPFLAFQAFTRASLKRPLEFADEPQDQAELFATPG